MSVAWAEEYSEEYAFHQYPLSEPRRCENPHCGHHPIFSVYILRNPMSGDVKEIGSYCKQRWNRIHGIATEAWFDEYDAMLQQSAIIHGGRLNVTEMKQVQRQARKIWTQKQVEAGKVFLQRIEEPIQNFPTVEEAEKYALERGGYCEGLDPSGKYYIIYVRREPTQKEKVLALVKERKASLVRVDLPLNQYPTKDDAENFAKEHGGYFSMLDSRGWIVYINPTYRGEY